MCRFELDITHRVRASVVLQRDRRGELIDWSQRIPCPHDWQYRAAIHLSCPPSTLCNTCALSYAQVSVLMKKLKGPRSWRRGRRNSNRRRRPIGIRTSSRCSVAGPHAGGFRGARLLSSGQRLLHVRTSTATLNLLHNPPPLLLRDVTSRFCHCYRAFAIAPSLSGHLMSPRRRGLGSPTVWWAS